jgi:hypothetical protein
MVIASRPAKRESPGALPANVVRLKRNPLRPTMTERQEANAEREARLAKLGSGEGGSILDAGSGT